MAETDLDKAGDLFADFYSYRRHLVHKEGFCRCFFLRLRLLIDKGRLRGRNSDTRIYTGIKRYKIIVIPVILDGGANRMERVIEIPDQLIIADNPLITVCIRINNPETQIFIRIKKIADIQGSKLTFIVKQVRISRCRRIKVVFIMVQQIHYRQTTITQRYLMLQICPTLGFRLIAQGTQQRC